MAIVLRVLKRVNQTDSILQFPFLDGLEKLVGQVSEIFRLSNPRLISLNVQLGTLPGELVDQLFIRKLSFLGEVQNLLEGLCHSLF